VSFKINFVSTKISYRDFTDGPNFMIRVKFFIGTFIQTKKATARLAVSTMYT